MSTRPRFSFDHLARSDLATEEAALEVDVQDTVPLRRCDFEEGGVVLDAGVVDQDVEPAELLYNGLDHLLDLCRLRDIGANGDRDRRPLALMDWASASAWAW